MSERRVVFTPVGLTARVPDGTTVLDAARSVGADLDSTCGGRGLCGRCQIVPSTGSFPKWNVASDADSLTAWSSTEDDYSGRRALADGARLGCAARVRGDVVVEIPATSQVHRPLVRKSVDVGDITVDPIVKLHYVEIPRAELGVEVGGLHQQIVERLAVDFDVRPTEIATHVLPRLAPCAKDGGITVAVRERRRITAAFAGYVDRAVGVAVDVGSTTIAGHLVDLATGEVLATNGVMNPQIRFGDDLMSRVSYVMMNPGGEVELTRAVRTALDAMIGDLVDDVGLERAAVLDAVLVGNPIMHHLVLGIDPTPLGQAPFTLATDGAVDTTATELGLDAPNATVHLLACIAGHVGADTAAVILSEGPHRSTGRQLVVDVGTNAEIVFGDSTLLLAASSPTGPAFEGAQISAGQRATTGAIERVRIDRSTLEPRIKVIGADSWSDEATFVADTMRLDVTGVCGSGIIEVVGEMYLSGIIDVDGTIRGDAVRADGSASARIVADGRTFSYVLHEGDGAEEIRVTQDDVRAIQLAKAALRAGIDLLVEHAGGPALDEVDSVRLAGAFGAHIDPLYAKVLGLVPDVAVDRVRSVGNAAGAGAVRALVSAAQREEIAQAVRRVRKIETATEVRFQELFVAAMGFPHTTEPTPLLASEIALPAPRPRSDSGRRRRRSRR
ncbi:ASKHA domain-containing protein [Ilumatobacter sp.]|uniref:ASKHA domain-containing protein n=1 Tax=Ilumatobacter sp. TaxID=1967498 RepID=UPI003B52AA79